MVAILVIISIVLLILCIMLGYHLFKARQGFGQWKVDEQQRIGKARRDAIEQSRAVLGGKFVEQMAPYLPEFSYDPTDARFIGSPIDLIVFPGLSEGNPEEVVLIEVKTGKSGRLTGREKKVRELVESGKVRWELIHRTATGEESPESEG